MNVHGRVYGSVAEALAAVPVDVLVDYTSAAAVKDDVETAVDAGVHVVVGSSGLTADDYAALDERAHAHRGVGVIAAGNFSVMAAILRRAAAMAAEHLDHSKEVLDYAGDTKADVPSGTSRELAETLAQVRLPAPGLPAGDVHGPIEARGVEVPAPASTPCGCPRSWSPPRSCSPGQGNDFIMRHDPGPDPEPYIAAGTLLAIRRVTDAVGVRRGLDSLLYD